MSDDTRYPKRLEERFQATLRRLEEGEQLDIAGWERLALLQRVAAAPPDRVELVHTLLDGAPFLDWQLDEPLVSAIDAGNEGTALALLDFGVSKLPLRQAAARGMSRAVASMITRGARFNRTFQSEEAPLHLAARAQDGAEETCRVLIDAGCDLTIRDPLGRTAAEIADEVGRGALAELIRSSVGAHGPRWFREAQKERIDHFEIYRSDRFGFGFNPNDVQAPLLTGNEEEGFGWPTTVSQARELLASLGALRYEIEWFSPFLDLLERGEDFSLDDVEQRAESLEKHRRR